MDHTRTWVENQVPLFAGDSRNKKGKTYPRPRVHRKTSRTKKFRSPLSPLNTSALPALKSIEVKRCALQTLGGGSGNSPPGLFEGNTGYKTQSSKATLRKMKPYGGSMFNDKCYLSSEDEREAEEEERCSWVLSPPDVDEFISDGRTAVTPPQKKPLALSSSGRRQNNSSAGTNGQKRTRRDGDQDRFSLPRVGEEKSAEPTSDSSEGEEVSDWRIPSKPPSHQTHKNFSSAKGHGAQRKAAKIR